MSTGAKIRKTQELQKILDYAEPKAVMGRKEGRHVRYIYERVPPNARRRVVLQQPWSSSSLDTRELDYPACLIFEHLPAPFLRACHT